MRSRRMRATAGCARRAAGLGAAISIALGAGLLAASPAAAAAPSIDPGMGAAAGGTTVTVELPGAVTFVDVASGHGTSYALDSDGNAWAWGAINWVRTCPSCGMASPISTVPVRLAMPAGVSFTDIVAGDYLVAALGDDGNVYSWGTNPWMYDALGDAGQADASGDPLLVDTSGLGAGAFTGLGVGSTNTGVVDANGIAYAWGENATFGTVGDGTVIDRPKLVPLSTTAMPAGVTFRDIAIGESAGAAIGSDGSLYGWGIQGNSNGVGAPALRPTAVNSTNIPAGTVFTSVSGGQSLMLAVTSTGDVYGWGTRTGASSVPTRIAFPGNVAIASVSAGIRHAVAVDVNGNAWGWGFNASGQIDDSGSASIATPTPMMPGKTFASLDAGVSNTIALDTAGNAWTWGSNTYGTAGDGGPYGSGDARAAQATPQIVTGVTFNGVAGTSVRPGPTPGTYTVVTPQHVPAATTVVVDWEVEGVAQTPLAFAGGFSFIAPIVVTGDPQNTAVDSGDTAVFNVAATGDTLQIQWQQSLDGGLTWTDIVGETGTQLQLVAGSSNNGGMFRAEITDVLGDVVHTQPAALTVNSGGGGGTGGGTGGGGGGTGGGGTGGGTGNGGVGGDLASTGAEGLAWFAWSGLGLLLVGGILTARRRRAHRLVGTHASRR